MSVIFLDVFKKNDSKIARSLQFSSRFLMKIDWFSITKKKEGTWPYSVTTSQIIQKMLPQAENLKNREFLQELDWS